VNYWLIENDINMFWFEGEHYRLANILSVLDIVLIAPIIEEIFFRGFLLTSLTTRFSIKNSILISSAIFGIVHTDLIGATIFGIVLSIIYLKAKSLYAPIIIHIANNALIFIVLYFYMVFENVSEYTITDFQNDWWIGLIGLIIGLPWFIYFLRKEEPNAISILPYFSNARV
jgi:membrane protease YdiL (CAAX protease family)